jgi:imidazolonepropionase-like amidohydrolase
MTTHCIRAGYLIDGSGEPIKKDAVLTIKDDLITAIAPFNRNDPPDPHCTDLSFATIVPPFIDCRIHLARSGTTNLATRKQQEEASFDRVAPIIKRHLLYLFRHGVIAARNVDSGRGHVLRYLTESRRESEDPLKLMVLKTSCGVVGQPVPNGRLMTESPVGNASGCCPETGQGDLVHLVNAKVDNSQTCNEETIPLFSREELQQRVNQAGKNGKKVLVQATGRLPVRQALEAGCRAIENGAGMGRENLQLMTDQKAILVPTLFAFKACVDTAPTSGQRKSALENLARQMEVVALARKLGVVVALGTDSGSPGILHGEAVVEEMKLLIKAGYTLAEAVQCATFNGACLLDMDAGLIAAGRSANFLVTRGMPAQLPRKFSYLEAIYINGKPSPLYRKNPIRGVF